MHETSNCQILKLKFNLFVQFRFKKTAGQSPKNQNSKTMYHSSKTVSSFIPENLKYAETKTRSVVPDNKTAQPQTAGGLRYGAQARAHHTTPQPSCKHVTSRKR